MSDTMLTGIVIGGFLVFLGYMAYRAKNKIRGTGGADGKGGSADSTKRK
jgi:hypothetical protein